VIPGLPHPTLPKSSSKIVRNFYTNLADKQTNRQTNRQAGRRRARDLPCKAKARSSSVREQQTDRQRTDAWQTDAGTQTATDMLSKFKGRYIACSSPAKRQSKESIDQKTQTFASVRVKIELILQCIAWQIAPAKWLKRIQFVRRLELGVCAVSCRARQTTLAVSGDCR